MATVISSNSAFQMDSEELAVLVLETAQNPLVLWDDQRRPLIFDAATPAVFGYSAQEFSSVRMLDLVHPDERDAARRQIEDRNAGDSSEQRYQRRMITQDGHVRHMDCMSSLIPLSGGRLGEIIDYRDISDQLRAEQRIQQQEALYRGIFERAETPIFTTNAEHHLTTANPVATELFGWRIEDRQDLNPLSLVHRKHRREIADWIVGQSASEEAGGEFEIPIKTVDGDYRWFAVDLNPIHRADGIFDGLHGFLRDVTLERRERERLQAEAYTDQLTGLANRRQFDELLAQEFESSRRRHTPLSLLMLDLDHFKQVNDTHGHPAGDAVLKNTARALRRVARRDDIVARYGGEEFAMILRETDLDGATTAAERCLAEIRATCTPWEAQTLCNTASVGVATFVPGKHQRAEDLLAQADAALYNAKQAGRNRVSIADANARHQAA